VADHPLSPGGLSLVVLDTCALLPPRLSDVLFDLALEGLYLPHWTAEIEAEFLRNFQAVTAAATPGTAARRLGAFRAAARMRHEIFGHMEPGAIARVPAAVDKKDAHVASAALMLARSADAGADKVFLVTANLEDLPPGELASRGVVTLSPGAFVDALHAAAPARVEGAVTRTLADLKKPPYTPAELLAALSLHGASATVKALSKAWGVAPAKGRRRAR
jgi:PIN domain